MILNVFKNFYFLIKMLCVKFLINVNEISGSAVHFHLSTFRYASNSFRAELSSFKIP